MGVLPGFGAWINQNIQQPLKAASKRSKHVKSSSVSEKDTFIQDPWYWDPDPKERAESMNFDHVRAMSVYATDPKYYDLAEMKRQVGLWMNPYPKYPWRDAPAKVKVKTKRGICHLNIDFTLAIPPQGAYEMFTDPRNAKFFAVFDKQGHSRLDTMASKVLKKDGPRQVTEVEKILRWKLLGYTGGIPIHLIIDENHQKVTATYKKVKVKYMKVFEGSWKVEPLYVDQERLCKSRSRISSEKEYKKCSSGEGRIASHVTMEHIFQPSPLLNVPPVSWFIRGIAIKFTKALLEDLRQYITMVNKIPDPLAANKQKESKY